MSKKVITAPWGKIRLSRSEIGLQSFSEASPQQAIYVEVWRRANGPVVDCHLMRADELAALGSEEVKGWLAEEGLI